MTKDALSGHTAAQNTLGADGLRDGDAMSSATLTNTLQGIHGSGLLRLEDNAFAATHRNSPNNQPGAITRASAFTLTITGGYVVLDGVLYEFAGGPGGSATMTLGDANHGSGGVALAAAGEEALYVIYAAGNNGIANVHYEGGSPVNVSNGLYPTIPSQYLTDYDTVNANTNMKTVVLAIIRVKYKSSGGGTHNVDVQEINDKRVFLPSSIRYMPPVSSGGLTGGNKVSDGAGEGVNTMTHLKDLLHTAGDVGDLAVGDTITALWPSHPRYDASLEAGDLQAATTASDPGFGHGPSRGVDLANNHVRNNLYFAGRNNEATGHYSVRLDGQGVDATTTELTGGQTYTITADGDAFFMLSVAGSAEIILNPETDGTNYKFPEGHVIEVCNKGVAGKGNIRFDQPELNAVLNPGQRATFIYEGSKWMSCNYPIAGGGVTDGDKGDIVVSSSGATWTIDDDAVTYAKMQNVVNDERILGRVSGANGVVEELTQAQVLTFLGGVEAGADVTDATNVTAAGALMDSEVTNLAQVKAFAASDYATAAQGAKADSAQQPPSEGAFANGDKTKLDAIAAGATAYTDLDAVNAVQAAATIELATNATFRAKRSVVLPAAPATLNLDRLSEAGSVTLCPGGQTVNLPDPGAAQDGDTYVIINVNTPSTGAITIDRSGFGGQLLNGAGTNGSLPAHEAVTLIYTGATGWYGIGL